MPGHFSANPTDHHILGHNVGIRPSRKSGVRVEKEFRDGQKIVHAYGMFRCILVNILLYRPLYLTSLSQGVAGGGYIFSFGVARAVRDLVEDFLFPTPTPRL